MNFYLDFEATQFSNEIISIGCVADNGARFSCFVKPHDKKKLTKFITELTGITQEMLDCDGVSADKAFLAFYQFVKENNEPGKVPTYYCYGNNDKDFIKHTVQHMTNFEAIIFASSVQALLVDYSNTVKSYLFNRGLALKKLVALIRHVDEVEQCHDALDDALMLKECFEGLDSLDRSAFMPTPVIRTTDNSKNSEFNQAFQQLVNEQGMLEPVKLQGVDLSAADKNYLKQLRLETWGQIPAEEVPGDATEENYMVKMTHIKKGHVKYFSTPTVAAMFLNAYILSSRSCKETKALNNTMKEMARNPNNFCGYRCELRMNDVAEETVAE